MTKPQITFSKKLFNPNYWHFEQAAKNPNWRIVIGYGGSSSAKSYSITQLFIKLALEEGEDSIVLRKVQTTIRKSIFKDFQTIISSWKLNDHFKVTPSDLSITCKLNGAKIDFTGLDDPEKIKGISQYKRVLMEELSEFEKPDFDQIRKRLRAKEGQQIFCLFNPVDETHWIKKELFDTQNEKNILPTFLPGREKEYTEIAEKWSNGKQEINLPGGGTKTIPPNFLVIRSTFKNNFWVVGSPKGSYGFEDIQTLADFEHDRKTDYNFYKVYALGLWGKLTVGGEFYKKFNPVEHVRPAQEIKYNDNLPLHISLDENVNPYITATIWQIEQTEKEKHCKQILELCLESPRNRIREVCKEIEKLFPNHKTGLFIYGDATSQKEDTKLEKGQNFFTLAIAYLGFYKPHKRVPKSNPSVNMRGNFINEILSSNYAGIKITISDSCSNSIDDLNYCKEDINGGKLKNKVKDKIKGITFEEYGHTSDTMDYFICEAFKKEYLDYQKGGKRKNTYITGGAIKRRI